LPLGTPVAHKFLVNAVAAHTFPSFASCGDFPEVVSVGPRVAIIGEARRRLAVGEVTESVMDASGY